jgi:cyanophycinase-like exopeptidase
MAIVAQRTEPNASMKNDKSSAGAEATRIRADSRAETMRPDIAVAVAAGANGPAEIAAYLNKEGIQTPGGGRWHAQTVRRTTRRLAALGYKEFEIRSRSDAQRTRAAVRRKREAAERAAFRAKYMKAQGITISKSASP